MDKNSNPFLNPEWLEMQRRYLESLTGASGHNEPEREDWQQALEEWRLSVMPLIPDESKPVFDSILGRSRSFYSLYTQFGAMLGEIAGAADTGEEWRSILRQHINQMKGRLDEAAGMDKGPESFQTAWLSSLDAWRQAFMFTPPDEILGGVQGEDLQELTGRFLSPPAFGPFREQYEAMQESIRLWQVYQEKCREFRVGLYRLGKEALDRLEEKILRMGSERREINSLKQLYDLWVESHEEVFSQYSVSEEYSILYGRLISSLMEFRRHALDLLENIYSQLDIPAGKDMKSVLHDQKILREALRSNQEEQKELRATIDELKEELERLQRSGDEFVTGRRKRGGESIDD